jgi:hypothetical protein
MGQQPHRNQTVTYDPMVGFTLNPVSLLDSSWYKCIATLSLPKPFIQKQVMDFYLEVRKYRHFSSNSLTHSLTHQPTCSTPLHCTTLHCTNSTELGWSSHVASEWSHRKRHLQHHLYRCMTSLCTWRVPLLSVYGPLPRNGFTCYIAHSLRLLSRIAYRHTTICTFPEVCACDVCDLSLLPSLWLGSHGDYSLAAAAAPSLRLLILSGSLIRCEPAQLYHHQPRSKVPFLTSLLSFRGSWPHPQCPVTHFL